MTAQYIIYRAGESSFHSTSEHLDGGHSIEPVLTSNMTPHSLTRLQWQPCASCEIAQGRVSTNSPPKMIQSKISLWFCIRDERIIIIWDQCTIKYRIIRDVAPLSVRGLHQILQNHLSIPHLITEIIANHNEVWLHVEASSVACAFCVQSLNTQRILTAPALPCRKSIKELEQKQHQPNSWVLHCQRILGGHTATKEVHGRFGKSIPTPTWLYRGTDNVTTDKNGHLVIMVDQQRK